MPIGAVVQTLVLFMLVALILQYEASGIVLVALLNGSLLYGMCAYIGTAAAYIKLKIVSPHIKRPFDAGYFLGITCAVFLICCCVTAMVQMFSTAVFRETLLVCVAKVGLQFLEFLLVRRHHMVETPEEQFIQDNLNEHGLMAALEEEEEADASAYLQVGGMSGMNMASKGNVVYPVAD
ncbi:hypothetical protein HDU98_007806 [Podochytrium sp. JEL0797]|nr:hypothetical protein HDU98_007806 [Podochytrium sp. JEL0797]